MLCYVISILSLRLHAFKRFKATWEANVDNIVAVQVKKRDRVFELLRKTKPTDGVQSF